MADDGRAARVIDLVQRLNTEVHPHASPRVVTLDSPFDDLGIGSLELAELLRRVQDEFRVTLPSHLLGTAETPRDLLRAVTEGRVPLTEETGVVALPATTGGIGTPSAASTLNDALAWHLRANPDRTHIRILSESGSPEDLSYAALHREAATVAAGLLTQDVLPGDTVAIMLPTSRAYFVTFVGVLLAGAVPVPIYPPARPSQLADHLRRHSGILTNARAVLLVTVPEAIPLGRLLRSQRANPCETSSFSRSLTAASASALPRPRSTDLALVQYTSGSTGQPKGVVLTHANLLANIRAMGQAADVSGADTFVSWLPLYHDMGLIGAWLGSLYYGMPLVIMPPQVFLTRPSRWLQAIDANRGTISAGSQLRLRTVPDARSTTARSKALDLSSGGWLTTAPNRSAPPQSSASPSASPNTASGQRRSHRFTGSPNPRSGLTFPPLGPQTIDRSGRPQHLRAVGTR